MDILDIIIVLALMIGVVVWLRQRLFLQIKIQMVWPIADTPSNRDLILATVSCEQGQFLLRDRVTDRFLCQGGTTTQLVDNFKTLFPRRDIAIVGGPVEVVEFVTQELRLLGQVANSK